MSSFKKVFLLTCYTTVIYMGILAVSQIDFNISITHKFERGGSSLHVAHGTQYNTNFRIDHQGINR